MRIALVTPAAPHARNGNRVTAVSWARVLAALGHRVRVLQRYGGEPCDLLVALHARRSHGSVVDFRARHPHAPLVVVLTGTDLYGDLPDDPAARESLRLADRLVVLQERGPHALSPEARGKTRVIVQSVPAMERLPPRRRTFDVAVVGHLRAVKDPFLAAEAARQLPADSRIRILHAGGVLEAALERRARDETARNPRYRWLGERPRWQARRLIARSRLMVLSSRAEGGAYVVGEAVTAGVPVLASAIPGNIGLLGAGYPGYFPPGDAAALAGLLLRCEREPPFVAALEAGIARAAPLFAPAREIAAWRALLSELEPGASAVACSGDT
jgi:putative glycosyltransferase (TIGR04348 family)